MSELKNLPESWTALLVSTSENISLELSTCLSEYLEIQMDLYRKH